jgi:hypothetical protein
LWQEVVLTDGQRLIMWRADDELSTVDDRERRVLNASVRTILLSTITDCVLTAEYEVLSDDTRRLSEVRLRMYTQLVTRRGRSRPPRPTSTASRSATTSPSTTAAWPRCNAFCSSAGCCRGACSSSIRRRHRTNARGRHIGRRWTEQPRDRRMPAAVRAHGGGTPLPGGETHGCPRPQRISAGDRPCVADAGLVVSPERAEAGTRRNRVGTYSPPLPVAGAPW